MGRCGPPLPGSPSSRRSTSIASTWWPHNPPRRVPDTRRWRGCPFDQVMNAPSKPLGEDLRVMPRDIVDSRVKPVAGGGFRGRRLLGAGQVIPGASIIAEYIEETHTAERENRLLRATPGERVEVRRLASWFNDKFHSEVSGPLVTERVFKRHMTLEQGGGPPDTGAMRAARHNIRYHLAYIGWLVRTRDWLAGDRLSLADLAAAAHLSAADYLGDVPWNADEAAKNWYARVKSRPSFRPLLADTLAGLQPVKSYAELDF